MISWVMLGENFLLLPRSAGPKSNLAVLLIPVCFKQVTESFHFDLIKTSTQETEKRNESIATIESAASHQTGRWRLWGIRSCFVEFVQLFRADRNDVFIPFSDIANIAGAIGGARVVAKGCCWGDSWSPWRRRRFQRRTRDGCGKGSGGRASSRRHGRWQLIQRILIVWGETA